MDWWPEDHGDENTESNVDYASDEEASIEGRTNPVVSKTVVKTTVYPQKKKPSYSKKYQDDASSDTTATSTAASSASASASLDAHRSSAPTSLLDGANSRDGMTPKTAYRQDLRRRYEAARAGMRNWELFPCVFHAIL